MSKLSAAEFRAYVEQHRDQIFEEMFLMFRSQNLMTHYDGVKGEAYVPIANTDSSNTFKKWKELSVNDGVESAGMGVGKVNSYRVQFHERYVPEALENGYFGRLRSKGQNPEDFPFFAHVVNTLMKLANQFCEKFLFKSVYDSNSDDAMALFDGLLKQLADAILNGDVGAQIFGIPYLQKYKEESIPTGYASILDIVEGLTNLLDDEMREGGAQVCMSYSLKNMYNLSYRNVHGTAPTTMKLYDINRTIVDGTEDAPIEINGVGGMSGSQRIFLTKKVNMTYSYDDDRDKELMNAQYLLNVLHLFGSFRAGSKFLKLNDTWMKCNELA